MVFKKSLWNLTGGFLNFRIEDLEFSWRSLTKGFKLIYVPKALVIHYSERNILQKIKKYLQYGKSYSTLVAIYHMEFIFKIEPHKGKKSFKYYLPLIIFSNIISFTLFICSFMFFNMIFKFSLLNFSLFFTIYLNFRFVKKIDIIYVLFRLSIMLTIIIYTLIYWVKKKVLNETY